MKSSRSSLLKDISRRRNLQRNKGKRSATAKPQPLHQSPGHLRHHLCLLLTFIICIFNLFDHANIGVVALAAPKTVSQARRQRSVEKARAKVHAFVAANSASSNATTTTNTIHQVTSTRPSVLVVDGNNVRGIGQCEWSPVEWMERVAAFCQAYRVDHYVVVWDHGPSPTVIALPHYNSNKQQQSSNNNNNNDHQNLCLFAGLSQRADDVMVHEATYLREYYCPDVGDDTHNDKEGADDTPDNTKSSDQTDHFHNFCFITNDGGLQGRLQQLGSDPRLRVLNTNGPLVLDATRFIALVQGVPLMESHDNNSNRDPEAPNSGTKDLDLVHQSVYRAEEQLQSFFAAKDSTASSLPSSKRNTRKYNPKREQTWQRCVLADAMVRGYADQFQQQQQHHDILDKSSCSYIREATQHRGFHTLSQMREHFSAPVLAETSGVVVAGSMRLDKKQKRMLARYNKMWMTADKTAAIVDVI